MATLTVEQEQQREALAGRILDAARATMDLFATYLGDELGYYRKLADGWHTSAQLAEATGTNERMTREWLEQQTVAGILAVEDASAGPLERCYRLPEAYHELLADTESAWSMQPMTHITVAVTRPIDELLRAFRDGRGVPLASYGRWFRSGQGGFNRAGNLEQLVQEWLPAMPDIHARMQQPGAKAADFGCGAGWTGIALGLGYPGARVDGFDLDEPSIEEARANAATMGVADRVNFQVRNAADPALAGQYDLVVAFECLHDMSDPVGALRTMRRLTAPGAAVLIVDERTGERFTPEGEGFEGLYYGFSVLHCLPASMADGPSAAVGTVIREGTVREFAAEAGFAKVSVLPIEHDFFRFYRLDP